MALGDRRLHFLGSAYPRAVVLLNIYEDRSYAIFLVGMRLLHYCELVVACGIGLW